MAEADRLFGTIKADEMVKDPSQLPVWTKNEVIRKHGEWVDERRRVLLILEGCVVDVGGYLEDHVRLSSSSFFLLFFISSLPLLSFLFSSSSSRGKIESSCILSPHTGREERKHG